MTIQDGLPERLEGIAMELRIDILRMLNAAKSGHTGGSLSCIDMLTVLFFHRMSYKPKDPEWRERDRFVMSKGHGAPALYATMAKAGYFPQEELATLRSLGTRLQGHPCRKSLPGIEVNTGSLGQGLSMGNGMALALRLNNIPSKVFAMLGDGELQEGMVWEAAMSAAHRQLDNITALVDVNGLQIDGAVNDIKSIDPLPDKWKAFGWEVFTIDGHSMPEILNAVEAADAVRGKPQVIIAKTVKGKGVSIFENKVEYHGVPPNDDELKQALLELRA